MPRSSPENLKILHLTTSNQTRGIADYTREIVAAMAEYGLQQEVYPLDEKNLNDLEKKAEAADLIHIQHEFSFFSQRSIHHSIDIFYQLLQQLHSLKKPVVTTFHTEAEFFGTRLSRCLTYKNFRKNLKNYRFQYRWDKKISQLFNQNNRFHAIVHTNKTRSQLAKSGIKKDKITTMKIGISPRKHLNLLTTEEAKHSLHYSKNTILLSIFGFITENKGHEFAIKALELLPEHYHLAIVGGPHPEAKQSNMEKILALSHANTAIKERIRITGYVNPQTADAYHKATDICLAPYHGQMSGSGAIGWALSSGKPTIASRTATFAEINQEANCLLLCEEKSVFELAWQIEYLIKNPDLQAQLIENALKYTATHQWSDVVKKIINCYEKCAEV